MVQWATDLNPEVQSRILASANHREPDRAPFWEHLNHRGVFEYFRSPPESVHETMSRAYRELGIDICRGYSVDNREATSSDALRMGTMCIKDLEAELKRKEGSGRDWDDFTAGLLEEYRSAQQVFAPHTMYVPAAGTGLTDLYVSVGLERFCLLLRDRPDFVGRLLRRRARDNMRWVRRAAEERLCPLFWIAEDVGGKNGLLFSPQWLREHFIPALSTLVKPLHAAGIKVIFHSDGNVMEILPDLIDAGIDGLHPIEPLADMDIALLKERFGSELVLVGNVDCGRFLPSASPQEIREAVRECRQKASDGYGGHFIGSSGELHSDIPLENVFAFCDACAHPQ